jgi:rhodanese-related sulfurtransferase
MNKNNFDFFIDVRTKDEFNLGHAKESVNIPLDQLENNFNKTELYNLDKNKKILLVCKSGGRAGVVKSFLEEKGFMNVQNGKGWENWK